MYIMFIFIYVAICFNISESTNIDTLLGATSESIEDHMTKYNWTPTFIITEENPRADSVIAAYALAHFKQKQKEKQQQQQQEQQQLQQQGKHRTVEQPTNREKEPSRDFFPVINMSKEDVDKNIELFSLLKMLENSRMFSKPVVIKDFEDKPWFYRSDFILVGHQLPEINGIPRENVIDVFDNNPYNEMLPERLRKNSDPDAYAISSTVVNYLLPYVEGSGGVMFRILRAIILLENENDPYRNTLDFRMITELAKDPELRSFNTDYSELLNIRTKFHTNQDFFDYIKQSLRIVWNSQRTKCILVGYVYVATIETLSKHDKGWKTVQDILLQKKCYVVVLFGEDDKNKDVMVFHKTNNASRKLKLEERFFGLFENHFATPLGIGLDNKLDSNVGSDYLGRKYIYRTPQRWKMLRKNFTALLMDGTNESINHALAALKSKLNERQTWSHLAENTINAAVLIFANDDIDSIASAIATAYYLKESQFTTNHRDKCNNLTTIIPVIHITREELKHRKDLIYFLRINQISVENLILFDELKHLKHPKDSTQYIFNSDLTDNNRYILISPQNAKYNVDDYTNSVIMRIEIRPHNSFRHGGIQQTNTDYTSVAAYTVSIISKFSIANLNVIYNTLSLLYHAAIFTNELEVKRTTSFTQSSQTDVIVKTLENMLHTDATTTFRFCADVISMAQEVQLNEVRPIIERAKTDVHLETKTYNGNSIGVYVVKIPTSVALLSLNNEETKQAIRDFLRADIVFIVGTYKHFGKTQITEKSDLIIANSLPEPNSKFCNVLINELKSTLKLIKKREYIHIAGTILYEINSPNPDVRVSISKIGAKHDSAPPERPFSAMGFETEGTRPQLSVPDFSPPSVGKKFIDPDEISPLRDFFPGDSSTRNPFFARTQSTTGSRSKDDELDLSPFFNDNTSGRPSPPIQLGSFSFTTPTPTPTPTPSPSFRLRSPAHLTSTTIPKSTVTLDNSPYSLHSLSQPKAAEPDSISSLFRKPPGQESLRLQDYLVQSNKQQQSQLSGTSKIFEFQSPPSTSTFTSLSRPSSPNRTQKSASTNGSVVTNPITGQPITFRTYLASGNSNSSAKEFLTSAKQMISNSKSLLDDEKVVFVVITNLCDLDSFAAAIVLTYYRELTKSYSEKRYDQIQGNAFFIPIIDFEDDRQWLTIKHEVIQVLKKFQISIDDFLFLNEISKTLLDDSFFILINHYNSNPKIIPTRIIEIFCQMIPVDFTPRNIVTWPTQYTFASDLVTSYVMNENIGGDFYHLLYCASVIEPAGINLQHLETKRRSREFNENDNSLKSTIEALIHQRQSKSEELVGNYEKVYTSDGRLKVVVVQLNESSTAFATNNVIALKTFQVKTSSSCVILIGGPPSKPLDTVVYFGTATNQGRLIKLGNAMKTSLETSGSLSVCSALGDYKLCLPSGRRRKELITIITRNIED